MLQEEPETVCPPGVQDWKLARMAAVLYRLDHLRPAADHSRCPGAGIYPAMVCAPSANALPPELVPTPLLGPAETVGFR